MIELPHLDKLQRRYGNAGLRVIALSTDTDGPAAVKTFLTQRGLTSLEVANSAAQAVLKPFQVRALPVSFIIDADGNMIGTVQGFSNWNDESIEHIALALQKRAQNLQTTPLQPRAVVGLD